MVDYSHLSAGNSSSPSSHDLLAEFGVSPSDLDAIRSVETDMGESIPVPPAVVACSDESSDNEADLQFLNPGTSQALPEVFRAANALAHKERLEAIEERAKNQKLMEFIASKGFTMADLNLFCHGGRPSREVSDLGVRLDWPAPPASPLPSAPPAALVQPVASLPKPSGLSPNSQPTDLVKSWSSVVLHRVPSSSSSLEYCPPGPSEADSPLTINPPLEVLKAGNERWSTCLMGGFITSKLPFKQVSETAFRLWSKHGLKKVFLHGKDSYVFQFSEPSDRDNILALGPWYFSNKLLVLNYWHEGLDLSTLDRKSAPIWVKFYNVPLSYWNIKGLSFLASGVGRPLLLDPLTEHLEPMQYARICIEITPVSPLPPSLVVNVWDATKNSLISKTVHIEYQSKPQRCTHCHTFGHSLLKCQEANFKWVPKDITVPPDAHFQPPPPPSTSANPPDDPALSPAASQWHTVSRGPKPLPPTVPPRSGSPPLASNPFSPISNSSEASPSDTDGTPLPNPLINKLKVVDEKEVRDIHHNFKAKARFGQLSKPAKKAKGGGSLPSP